MAKSVLAALPHNDLFFAVDHPKYTILEITDHFLETMGKTREELIGKGLLEAFPDNTESNARELIVSFQKVLEKNSLTQWSL